MNDQVQPCPACAKAIENPLTGLTTAGCVGCAIRELARSPQFHRAKVTGSLGTDYVAKLKAIFGDDWLAGHDKVKAHADQFQTYGSMQKLF